MRTPRPIPSPRPLAAAALVALLAGVPAVAHAAAIPRRLDRIESLAEDAYDAALAGKQAAVRNKAEALARLWAAYRPTPWRPRRCSRPPPTPSPGSPTRPPRAPRAWPWPGRPTR